MKIKVKMKTIDKEFIAIIFLIVTKTFYCFFML